VNLGDHDGRNAPVQPPRATNSNERDLRSYGQEHRALGHKRGLPKHGRNGSGSERIAPVNASVVEHSRASTAAAFAKTSLHASVEAMARADHAAPVRVPHDLALGREPRAALDADRTAASTPHRVLSKILPGQPRPAGYNVCVNFPDLETEALKLPVVERARLAETLLKSLDALSEDEHRRSWTEEATRRDAELDADPSRGRPADEVFRDTRARLR
jgi:putative addiction module component (TIGR02574 family)